MSTRFGFVSTFPPTQCGLATFTAALRGALLRSTTDEGWAVRLVDAAAPSPGDEVVAQLITGDSALLRRAAGQLNLCDVAIVQHEYGVYGGADGSQILHVLDQVRVPCVVVLHTVLTDPTPHQRQVLESVIAKADAVVAMTVTAHERLAARYAVDMAKVCIIAHGAPALLTTMAEPTFRTGQFTVLTWGLLGPGKGIEWGIEAMAMLRDLQPMRLRAGRDYAWRGTRRIILRSGDIAVRNTTAAGRCVRVCALVTSDGIGGTGGFGAAAPSFAASYGIGGAGGFGGAVPLGDGRSRVVAGLGSGWGTAGSGMVSSLGSRGSAAASSATAG
jgi:hypothetical protein